VSTMLRPPPVNGADVSRRLLHDLEAGNSDASLRAHLARRGPLAQSPAHALLDELDASGLVGHGGAWFPVGTKWRSVASASRRSPVVVANGAEGEPASAKDALLLNRAPHLVLDGLSVAAHTLDADRAFVYVSAATLPRVRAAAEERHRMGVDDVAIEVVEAPDTFISGQETAVVNALRGKAPLPTFAGLRTIRERGISGRPTLVQNVETLAHVALLARYGATWFRGMGTPETPGTLLLTLTEPDGRRVVVEAELGAGLAASVGLGTEALAQTRGVLLGGYGGGWVSTETFGHLQVNEKAVRRAGSSLGAGVVVPLPTDFCPLAEMADVVRYMEGQGARQCGPCVFGLASLAEDLADLAYSRSGGKARVDRVLQVCTLVEGRGACRHPDGVARFVRTGLSVFADELALHQRHGACKAAKGTARLLPIPNGLGRTTRRLVSRA
jgi:NADH:ubiquinone oxidoreductase subunit F (NADH-binding)